MLNLSEGQKKLFYTSGYFNNYILTFPDINLVIDNDKLHSETVVIKESICDEEDLTLGGCIASSIEFEVSEILADQISGLEFTVQIEVTGEDGSRVLRLPMGIFRVDEVQMVDDKDYKKVIAYDRMYDASADISEWYQELFGVEGVETVTVKEMRESLLDYLGLPFISQTLPNDEMTVSKTIEPSAGSLPGTDVLRAMCVLNGGFGRMDRQGRFEVIYLKGFGVFPEDSQGGKGNLYPEETLYPEDSFVYLEVSDEEQFYPEYRSCHYEEYMTQPITCLTIQTDEEDIGVTIGEDTSNPYLITANFLLYGKSAEELRKIGKQILKRIQGITYRPNTTELNGLPYLEPGDAFALVKKNDMVESFIFSRTLSGIQALIDTFEVKGNKVRGNEVSANDEILQLQGKILSIKKETGLFSVNLKDIGEKTESLLEMTASTVVLQVDKDGKVAAMALDASGDTVNFNISADSIVFEGNKIDLTAKELSVVSDKFQVDENGNVTANAIEIHGGSIDIETGYHADNVIHFRYMDWEGFSGTVDYYGQGEPETYYQEPLEGGLYYLDLDSGKLYVSSWAAASRKFIWNFYGNLYKEQNTYREVLMNSEGFHVGNYEKILLETDQDGEQLFSNGDSASLSADRIVFSKEIYEERMGVVHKWELEGSVRMEKVGYDGENAPVIGLKADVPCYAPNIKTGKQSLEFEGITARQYVTFEQEFLKVPVVTCTPMGENHGMIGCFVNEITAEGFYIDLIRTMEEVEDPERTDTIDVNWIAIQNEEVD